MSHNISVTNKGSISVPKDSLEKLVKPKEDETCGREGVSSGTAAGQLLGGVINHTKASQALPSAEKTLS